jgi:Bacteriophage minor capsid protein
MIQGFFVREAKTILTDLEWTQDFYTAEDNTGTVYSEGGEPPDTYESDFRFPEYMVFIRSSDWSYAEGASQKVFDHFHKRNDFIVSVEQKMKSLIVHKQYKIFFIEALSEPLRLGVKNNIMEYSINFRVTLKEVKE